MPLITTPGAPDADSYATAEAYRAYGAAMGWQIGQDGQAVEIILRRAAAALDRRWTYRGRPTSRDQSMAWPRADVGPVEGHSIDNETVPERIRAAQFELAHLIEGGIDPLAPVEGVIKSRSRGIGPMQTRTEYAGGHAGPRLTSVVTLLRPLLLAGPSQQQMVRA